MKLNPISKQNVTVKTFGSRNGYSKYLGEFQFMLKGLRGKGLR